MSVDANAAPISTSTRVNDQSLLPFESSRDPRRRRVFDAMIKHSMQPPGRDRVRLAWVPDTNKRQRVESLPEKTCWQRAQSYLPYVVGAAATIGAGFLIHQFWDHHGLEQDTVVENPLDHASDVGTAHMCIAEVVDDNTSSYETALNCAFIGASVTGVGIGAGVVFAGTMRDPWGLDDPVRRDQGIRDFRRHVNTLLAPLSKQTKNS